MRPIVSSETRMGDEDSARLLVERVRTAVALLLKAESSLFPRVLASLIAIHLPRRRKSTPASARGPPQKK
jgi:hypothetical protein